MLALLALRDHLALENVLALLVLLVGFECKVLMSAAVVGASHERGALG